MKTLSNFEKGEKEMNVIRATINELDHAATLFDQYRVFYEQESKLDEAREFLKERLENHESVIFLAYDGDRPVGFTQLYPSFSSVGMRRTWVLNDLFVAKEARRMGVGHALINQAIDHAKVTDAKGILLETATDNHNAQALYEKIGFERETNYFYFYSI